jgi:hypothetical protein
LKEEELLVECGISILDISIMMRLTSHARAILPPQIGTDVGQDGVFCG